jgi:hypothetical protein
MNWLTIAEYQFDKNVRLSLYHNNRFCNKINTANVTNGAGTTNPSGAPVLTPVLVEFLLLNR